MRLIDAERMPNDKFWQGLTDIEKAKVLQWFVSAPTVDAVEVVRCQDCAYCEEMQGVIGMCLYCHRWRMDVNGDVYCSYGERGKE